MKPGTTKRLWKTRQLAVLLCIALLILPIHDTVAAPAASAEAYALIEAQSGRLLLTHQGQTQLPMASTTKIMTCILAIERGDLDETVEIPAEAVGIEGSSIYLQHGETMTLRDLLYGLMLASGNDAAVAIAIHIGGSEEGFATLMNEKAADLGAEHTQFVTPNGLPAEGHYTTAEDLARIAAYAMGNETFREIVGTASMDLAEDDDSPARYLRSKNKVLSLYEGGNGIKTGYTKAAGRCLAAGAYREALQLVAVVLNAPTMFEDCYALLDYGFDTYDSYRVAAAGEQMGHLAVTGGLADSVEIAIPADISLPLEAEEYKMVTRKVHIVSQVQAPVYRGMVVGSVDFCLDGTVYASADLIATQDVLQNTYGYHLSRIIERWFG